MNERILMIEDEPGAAMAVGDRLVSEGYIVDLATDGEEGYRMAIQGEYDLILLDLMLPGKDGITICRDLRDEKITTPVIMVTARGEVFDRILGLNIGADDYLAKPFDPMELIARMEAVLRRSKDSEKGSRSEKTVFEFGPFSLNSEEKELFKNGDIVALSSREYQLLLFLVGNRNRIFSRDELLDNVWGYDSIPSTRTVDVHIAWLRQKLGDTGRKPQYIQTVTKRGYKFIC